MQFTYPRVCHFLGNGIDNPFLSSPILSRVFSLSPLPRRLTATIAVAAARLGAALAHAVAIRGRRRALAIISLFLIFILIRIFVL